MQSAKKRVVALSALSMAAVATLGTTKSAKGVTFGFYYDNMSILSGPDGSPTSGSDYQDGLVTSISNNGSATAPATVTLQVGQVLEFGMSAAVTGDTAPSAGTQEVVKKVGQGNVPANIGASELGIQINSSDATGANLSPLSHSSSSTAYLNMSTSAPKASGDYGGGNFNGTGLGQGSNNGSATQYIPFWTGEIQKGSVNGGGVGSNGGQTISGGSALANTAGEMTNNPTSIESLGEFGAPSQSISNATDFFDSLQFQAVSAGTVTLSPFSNTGQDEYWSQTNTATTAASSLWKVEAFGTNSNDTVLAIPQLVVVIAGATTGSPASPIFSVTTATPGAAYGSQVLNGSGANNGTFTGPGASNSVLTVVGAGGVYAGAQVNGISGGAGTNQGFVEANGFSPATDKEIFALDVEVGGTQASASQLNTLLIDASSIGGGLPVGLTVTTLQPAPDPFGSNFNFFLDVNPGVGSPNFLGLDLLSTNDSNLAGYTVSAVAVVPEPMSLGLLALGGVGLMARRNRRKA